MHQVTGDTLSAFIRDWDSQMAGFEEMGGLLGKIALVGRMVGLEVAKMHSVDVVHGDLTPSNVLLPAGYPANANQELEITWIDFGSSRHTTLVEDKAVDLYVLERAMHAMGAAGERCWSWVLEGYSLADLSDFRVAMSPVHRDKVAKKSAASADVKDVLNRFEKGIWFDRLPPSCCTRC